METKITTPESSSLRGREFAFEKFDCKFKVAVSPCSWMYENYGLQIGIEMEGGGTVYVLDPGKKPYRLATEADVERLFSVVKVKPCQRCGKPAFDPESVETNRNHLCEACFMSDLNAEFGAATAKEEQKRKRKEAKLKKDGFQYAVDAWVHPGNGDDYMVSIYLTEVDHDLIKAELKKAGSMVQDDYKVRTL